MCDPGTAAMMTIAAGGAKTAGAVINGYQQRAIARYNAAQMVADAAAEEEAAKVKADTVRKAGRFQKGAARAGLAASGANVDSGTAGTIQDEIAGNVEYDAWTELLQGKAAGRSMRAQAQVTRQQGSNAFTAGLLGGSGNLLSTGAEYADRKGWGTSKR